MARHRKTGTAARVIGAATTIAAVLLLAGCNHKASEGSVGQVIGHIGTDDITQQEMLVEMQAHNVPADKQTDPTVIRKALADVATRKYLTQQAIAAKLDRQPATLLEILRARESVLAAKIVQREMFAKNSAFGNDAINGYIQSHSQQFTNRQMFTIDQISFPVSSKQEMDEISTATKDFKILDQVDAKLNELNIKHVRHPGKLDGGTMPETMLNSLLVHKDDDVFFLRAGDGAMFFKVQKVEPQPVGGEDAKRIAHNMLQQDTLRKFSADAEKAALASAKFDGDFARIMAEGRPAASAIPAAAPAPSPSQTP